jgi:antitoxin MazE
VKTRIVKIGNSQGIRIPKPLLHQTGLAGEVEISVEEDHLIIGPARMPRSGWEEAFKAMGKIGDDAPLEGERPVPTEWEREGWEWR